MTYLFVFYVRSIKHLYQLNVNENKFKFNFFPGKSRWLYSDYNKWIISGKLIDVYLKHFLFSYTSYCHTWLFGRNSWHGCITFRKINHWCGNEILFEQNIYSHNFLTNSVKHNVFCLVTSSDFHCLVGQERKHVARHWKVCSDDVVNGSNCCRRTSNDTNYNQNPAVDPFP